jgi:hypothetical protein
VFNIKMSQFLIGKVRPNPDSLLDDRVEVVVLSQFLIGKVRRSRLIGKQILRIFRLSKSLNSS